MLSQKSFLETKLVERLQAAFQTSAELKAELQTKDYGTPKIHLNDIVQGYRSQNTLTIQYLMSIDTIKTLVEINLGFSIEKMILCKSLTPRHIFGMKVCSSNVVELFSEKVVNRSIYVEDFKRLKKESLALSLSIKNYHYENNYTCKFIDGNSNSVAKLRYLTDRLVILRKLNIPRRMKTMQNEYLAKLHELNRMLRQEFTWNSVELKKMIQVVRENEVEVTEHTRLLFQKISKEELLRDISTRSGGNQLEYPLLTPSENLTQRNRSLQATILSLKDRRGDDRRDRFTSDNDIAMNIIEKKESALFKLFAKELSDHMTASLQLTVKALSLKNRSMDSIVNNYETCSRSESQNYAVHLPIVTAIDRLEDIDYRTQSFARHQEILRNDLMEHHTQAVKRRAVVQIERRFRFLERMRQEFRSLTAIEGQGEMF